MKKNYLLAVIPFTLVISGCKTKEPAIQQAVPVPVKVTEVLSRNYYYIVRSAGRLSTSKEQKLSFKTGGIIRNIFVTEGQSVNRGDLLASLDLSEIHSQVNQAKDALDKAERDYKRVLNLYNDSVATLEQLQNANTMLQISKSNYDIAFFNLQHSSITAPSRGKILKILMEENEMAGPGYPVILFGSTEGHWIVRISVTDRDRVNLTLNDTASVRLDAFASKTFKARISELSDMADPFTGTFEVELTLEDIGKLTLLTGMIARVEIYANNSRQLLALPVESLFQASGDTGYVYEVVNGKPVKKAVALYEIGQNEVLVSSGLKPGSYVVSDNVNALSDSANIIILP
jgi:RND family efflux transporter MFP subunit